MVRNIFDLPPDEPMTELEEARLKRAFKHPGELLRMLGVIADNATALMEDFGDEESE